MQLTLLSLGLAVAAVVFLQVYPVYSGSDGTRPTRATLLEVNGQWATVPVLLPVVVAFVPIMFPHRIIRIIASCSAGSRHKRVQHRVVLRASGGSDGGGGGDGGKRTCDRVR